MSLESEREERNEHEEYQGAAWTVLRLYVESNRENDGHPTHQECKWLSKSHSSRVIILQAVKYSPVALVYAYLAAKFSLNLHKELIVYSDAVEIETIFLFRHRS